MRKEIETKIKGIFDSFVSDLERERGKFIDMQKNQENTMAKIAKEETLRKAQHKEGVDSLDKQKQKTIEEKFKWSQEIDALKAETQSYNKLVSEANIDRKEIKKNLNESIELKKIDQDQLKKNKDIEDAYNNKIKFLQEDVNSNAKKTQELNYLERKLIIKEKAQNKKDQEQANLHKDLSERKKSVEVREERLKLKGIE